MGRKKTVAGQITKGLTSGHDPAAKVFGWLIVAGIFLFALPFVISFYVYRAALRSAVHYREAKQSGIVLPLPEGTYPLWATAPAATAVSIAWLFVLVVVPYQNRIERETLQAAEAEAFALQQRNQIAARARFEASRPTLNDQLRTAREQGNAGEISRIAEAFSGFDGALAATLRAEVELLALAERCTPQGTSCPLNAIEEASARGVSAVTAARVREACRQRFFNARPPADVNLNAMTAFALRGWRSDAICLQRLSGEPPVPTVAQYDAAIDRVERRELREAERQARESVPPPEPVFVGGGSTRGSGRCRDSRGRFTRCL